MCKQTVEPGAGISRYAKSPGCDTGCLRCLRRCGAEGSQHGGACASVVPADEGGLGAGDAVSALQAKKEQIPFWEKASLTLEEAAAYSGIGLNTLRQVVEEPDCSMVFYVRSRRLIKRKKLDEWIDRVASC